MSVHSLHSYFLRPGDTAVPIVYDVERVRDGRSFATRRVLARQHGRPIYGLTASFQVAEDGFEHQDAMPEVPVARGLPSTCPRRWRPQLRAPRGVAPRVGRAGPAARRRLPAGGALEDPDRPARVRYWIRVAGRLPDDASSHRAALTYISDMTLLGATLVPHGLHPRGRGVQAASLDHTVWFHRPFRADEWLLYDQSSPTASGGRGLALGRLFTPDGRMVASVAQEGLIRPRR